MVIPRNRTMKVRECAASAQRAQGSDSALKVIADISVVADTAALAESARSR